MSKKFKPSFGESLLASPEDVDGLFICRDDRAVIRFGLVSCLAGAVRGLSLSDLNIENL